MSNKCVFLDRDGVINLETGDYNYRVEDFVINDGVGEALKLLKNASYLLVVITNQAGISKGLYTHEDVKKFHQYMQQKLNNMVDDIYYSPYHPLQSESLSRKPGSLMFERAVAKYNINTLDSWMVGDKESDLIPAKKLQMRTIMVRTIMSDIPTKYADHYVDNLKEGVEIILN